MLFPGSSRPIAVLDGLLSGALGFLVVVTVLAVGSYVGTLRALAVFDSDDQSGVFLADETPPR